MSRHFSRRFVVSVFIVVLLSVAAFRAEAQGTRLLRQPTVSSEHVAFAHGGDLWVASRAGGAARRLTSTPAVEQNPRFSPDGRLIAFTSNRSGVESVYVLPVEGGNPTRLTWYPAASYALGWTPDGSRVLYASSREAAPAAYQRLWTVSPAGGPSELLPAPRGHDGSFSGDGSRIVVDRVARWDHEWRRYRGGQNKPLVILDLSDLSETALPNDRSVDLYPIWTLIGLPKLPGPMLAGENALLSVGCARAGALMARPATATNNDTRSLQRLNERSRFTETSPRRRVSSA